MSFVEGLTLALNVIKPESVFTYFTTSSLAGTFVTSILGINMFQGVIIPIFVGWAQEINLSVDKGLLAVWLPSILGGNLLPSLLPSVLFAWTFKYKGEKLFTFGDGFKISLVAYAAYYIVSFLLQNTYWNLF